MNGETLQPQTRREFLAAGVAAAAALVPLASASAADLPGEALAWKPATELAKLIRDKKLSPVELTDAILQRIDALNPKLNAFLYVDHEGAMAAAKVAEVAVVKREKLGLLHGLPVTIKDSSPAIGMPTTNGTKIAGKAPAKADSYLTGLSRSAGAVIVGKTNLPAFAHKDITENLIGPPCPTPWNLKYNAGGSSGGAAAAAVAGLGPLHQGTDGGGSLRIPADRCGAFGFKPSIGRISHPGAIARGCGLGHYGPVTRTVADAALIMDVWSGPNKFDYLSIDARPDDFTAAVAGWKKALQGKKVGFTLDYGWVKAVDPEVRRLVTAAALKFADLGCTVETVAPNWPSPLRAWEALWLSIAASKRPLFENHPDWLDESFRLQMDAGDKISGVDVAEALETKDAVFQAVQKFFDGYDLLLSPVCAVPTFPFGQEPTQIDGKSVNYLDVRIPQFLARIPFTPTFNMTGHPAASVPCGFTKDGLPVGLHVIGGWHQDALVLQASAGFEAIQPWADRKPMLA